MADNKTQIVISAKDETSAAFASAKAGLDKFQQAYAQLGGIAGAGVAAALIASVKSAIDLGDEMNDLSQKVGISVESLSAWSLAAAQSGTNIESVAKGVKGLSKFMLENGDALKKAGVDAKDANGALVQLADLFSAMPDGVQKTALAVKIFGKAGMDMIPMLNMGSDGLREAAEKSAEYGRKMALLAPMADKFNDQLAEMALHSKETGMNISNLLLPGLIGMVTWFNDLAAGGKRAETALEFLSEKSPLFRGLVEFNKLTGKIGALAGAGGDPSKRSASGKIGGKQSGLSIDDEIALGDKNEKTIDALRKANELLGKESGDRESQFLAGLRQQLTAATGDTSEYSKMLITVSQGSAKDFSAATKGSALALAKQIDVLKENTKTIEQRARVLEKVASAEAAAAKTMGDFGDKQSQAVGDVTTKTSELGKTPLEIKQAEAARKIQKDYEDAVKKINEELGKIGDIDGIDAATYRLTKGRDEATANMTAALQAEKDAQDALNSSWEYGADTALRKYADEVNNVASATENAMTRAFKGMEDSLVNFVKTGKLDFKSLADSILTDLIRIQVRQSIMKPISDAFSEAGGFGGIARDLFGGFKAAGGPVNPGQYYVVGENGPEVLVPNSSGTIIPNHAIGGGGGTVNNVSVTVNAEGGKSQGDGASAAELGRRIEGAVRSVLIMERRPGGLLGA